MKSKKQHHEEHVDETWLLPYSDMLTLLLALFIVMFAMSKVDQQKFQRLSQEFNAIFTGGTGILNDTGGKSKTALSTVGATSNKKTNLVMEQDQMTQIKSKLQQEIKSGGYQDRIGINLNSEGLTISIQDNVIFNSGEAEVLSKFDPVLVHISNMIKPLDNDIRVSGHTDNIPIKSGKFNSNWDLSYERALNVMNFLVDIGQLKPQKFSIQAYGEYNNKYDNSTEAGRAKNRSVDILIVRKYH
jgi:chemotaxis protein MotB